MLSTILRRLLGQGAEIYGCFESNQCDQVGFLYACTEFYMQSLSHNPIPFNQSISGKEIHNEVVFFF